MIHAAADDPHELSAREAQQQQHNNNASFRALDYKKQVQNLIEAGKRLLCSSGHYHQHTGTLADAEQSALPPVAESTAAAAADQAFAPPEAHPIACYFPPRVDADDDNVWPRFSPPSAAAPQKKRSRAPYDHTPRPSNSFMIYRREKQAEILAQYRGQKALHNNTISKVVADMWRGETPEVRQQYAAKADEEKIQHMIKYPGYKYTPRRGATSSAKRKKSRAIAVERQPLSVATTDARAIRPEPSLFDDHSTHQQQQQYHHQQHQQQQHQQQHQQQQQEQQHQQYLLQQQHQHQHQHHQQHPPLSHFSSYGLHHHLTQGSQHLPPLSSRPHILPTFASTNSAVAPCRQGGGSEFHDGEAADDDQADVTEDESDAASAWPAHGLPATAASWCVPRLAASVSPFPHIQEKRDVDGGGAGGVARGCGAAAYCVEDQ
ncbi:hypothetical protein HDU83_002502 [Entophlyctis luteolus]|nr:hypothetical protein HDU83_002502 [Entophlyctis luteolus]